MMNFIFIEYARKLGYLMYYYIKSSAGRMRALSPEHVIHKLSAQLSKSFNSMIQLEEQ